MKRKPKQYTEAQFVELRAHVDNKHKQWEESQKLLSESMDRQQALKEERDRFYSELVTRRGQAIASAEEIETLKERIAKGTKPEVAAVKKLRESLAGSRKRVRELIERNGQQERFLTKERQDNATLSAGFLDCKKTFEKQVAELKASLATVTERRDYCLEHWQDTSKHLDEAKATIANLERYRARDALLHIFLQMMDTVHGIPKEIDESLKGRH